MPTTDPLYELHQSIISTLKADSTLATLINGVYSNLPQDAKFPCIAVENTVARDASTRTTNGFHVGVAIKVFSRARDSKEASSVLAEVRRILDSVSLSPTGCKVSLIKEVDNSIHRLIDGVTWSASINFLVILQEGGSNFVGSGNQFVIKIGNGAAPTETFTTIGGLKNAAIGLANKMVDSTNLSSGKWRALLGGAGVSAVSVSGNGFFTDSAAEETLRAAAFSGAARNYEIILGNNDKISGAFIVSVYKRSGNVNSEEDFAVSLESSGTIVFSG